MVFCTGCRRKFKPSGYTIHIRRSQTSACGVAYRENLQAAELNNSRDDVEEETHFQGDFFGDYDESDLPWPVEAELDEDNEVPNDDDYMDLNADGHEGGPPNHATMQEGADDIFVEHFPSSNAGAAISDDQGLVETDYDSYKKQCGNINDHAPFASRVEWDIARWAKVHGITSTAVTELLGINGLVDALGLSFKNSRELNSLIDCKLPGRPRFRREDVVVGGETFAMYSRDILECINALYSDADFAEHLLLKPERHYKHNDRNQRVYHDMHTGEWWWQVQKTIEGLTPGATVVPVIISTDRTQVTQFGNKTAYPVYLTIGNLPKDIRRKPSRRGQILLAYLPSTKLKHVSNLASRRRMLANLYHSALSRLLRPLEKVGLSGIVMRDGYGIPRRLHPILAVYIGDYPEQVLATGTKTGECPKCDISPDKLGSSQEPFKLRDLNRIREALLLVDGDPRQYTLTCKAAGIKPLYHPFWESLPFCNIFQSITPDVLHQLLQGVFKHLVSWIISAYGATEINARFQRIIPNRHIRIFTSGITGLSRVTGKEYDQISRVILGVILDIRLHQGLDPARLLRAVRGIIDFVFLSQLPVQTSESLRALKQALQLFHDNKSIFVDLGIRENFNIPKLHSCRHYISSIKLFGSTDNYSTQHTERLHIDFAKDAYRATNMKDELVQMTAWLERKEKIQRHERYIQWRLNGNRTLTSVHVLHPQMHPRRILKMARQPSARAVSIDSLVTNYGATYFRDALARFAVQWQDPSLPPSAVERQSVNIQIPFVNVSTYYRVKYTEEGSAIIVDSIHAQPKRNNRHGHPVSGRFDTVLVHVGSQGQTGVHAHRVGQVRAVFSIGTAAAQQLFGSRHPAPMHLAYVEWFTPFRPDREPHCGMFKISRSIEGNSRLASIVITSRIRQSIHIFPCIGPSISRVETSSTIIDNYDSFLVNPYSDRRTFLFFSGLADI